MRKPLAFSTEPEPGDDILTDVDRPDIPQAIEIFLAGVFKRGSIRAVWKYVHPDTRAHLIDKFFPDGRPTIEDLDAAVVAFFVRNLADYDHETWGIHSSPTPVGPGLEEYWIVANAEGYDPAFPVLEGYRMTMEYDPDLDPSYAAGWYLVGIKGEILK